MTGTKFINPKGARNAIRSDEQRIAFVHHKGGTGKTTTCLNIAGWLSKMNQKVLVVDLDPQANATSGLGVDLKTVQASMYDVLLNQIPINEIILETRSGIKLAPGSSDLLSAEMELAQFDNSVDVLNHKLHRVQNLFNFILIDCPPGSTLLMMNGMVATKNIIIPLDSGIFGFETLETLKTLILELEDELDIVINIKMAVLKVFSSALLDRSFTKDIRKMILEYFAEHGLKKCKLRNIPFSSKICQAQLQGQPISHFAPTSRVGKVYQKIAKDLLLKEIA